MAKKLLSELKEDIAGMSDKEVLDEILLNQYLSRKANENAVKAINSVKWTIIFLIVLAVLGFFVYGMLSVAGL